MAHIAQFLGDDPPQLVQAALACHVCLGGDVEWRLDLDEDLVRCRCRTCGADRDVVLNSAQSLRLALQPDEAPPCLPAVLTAL